MVAHKQGLMVGARSFPGNPHDCHVLSVQLDQTTKLLQNTGRAPKQVIVGLVYRGVYADNPGVRIIHRGKYKSLSDHEKRLLERRQARAEHWIQARMWGQRPTPTSAVRPCPARPRVGSLWIHLTSPGVHMRTAKLIIAAATLGAASIPGISFAEGCLKGAAVGGVAGHVAGHHAILGAAAGCAIEHHREKKAAKKAAAMPAEPATPATPTVTPAQPAHSPAPASK